MRTAGRILLVLVASGALAGAGIWLWFDHWRGSAGPLAEAAIVDLPQGTGVRAIARRLAEAGVVDHPLLLEALARLTRRDRDLLAGEYRFTPGMSPDAVIALLRSGRVVLHPITVPEGLTVVEVYDLLAKSEVLAGDLPPLPEEGSLFPDTYLVPRGEPRAKLVGRMEAAMDANLEEVWAGRAAGLPLDDPREALTLASIIERETALPAEYPLVAAVFVNRLERGMRLQTDPTVIYGLADGKGSLGRPLTRADLTTAHAYNTYEIDGLPPGPIANPGRGALEAAVRPADVDYLYFVADGDGGHAFARTLAEHNRNVQAWRRQRDAAPAAASPGEGRPRSP